ncbi:hypothetical protein BpHYR1_012267 [Brachionus plicatilis]|uniref:Uncharacterized protein n=1 Tax=Brachionus plicatilis TaxID=10195 RepID=A0A3M7S9M2_BRAPC|nr:hypothetical protein BpHYR1_012267 [Brachionus plicatilis]
MYTKSEKILIYTLHRFFYDFTQRAKILISLNADSSRFYILKTINYLNLKAYSVIKGLFVIWDKEKNYSDLDQLFWSNLTTLSDKNFAKFKDLLETNKIETSMEHFFTEIIKLVRLKQNIQNSI